MPEIRLKYGRTEILFEYDPGQFEVLAAAADRRPLTDVEIGERLDSPIGSEKLEDIVGPGETVLLVVPDATREAAAGQIVNLVVRRLIANGSAPADINIIFATGIHRAVTAEEKAAIVTPFIAQRIKMLDHRADNALKNFRVGETSGGIPVELDWALTEYDRIVLIGGVAFHYFAGFTGGRKMICPGLASAKTIAATHALAFDCDIKDRRENVAPGMLDGNPVHETFVEAASFAKPAFAVSTIVNDAGGAVDVFCGDWIESHRAACDAYAAAQTFTFTEKRPLVIASCGGHPHDINMIQAHKALDAAAQVCTDGGTIVLLAECPDGTGRPDFLDWFDAENSSALASRLCENYHVNAQTAWSLLKKTENFDVRIVTTLGAETVQKMRMRKLISLAEAPVRDRGYILPTAAKDRYVAK